MIARLLDSAKDSDRIRCQMPEYLSEMAQYDSRHTSEPDANSQAQPPMEYPYLEHYWREPDRYPYLIQDEQQDCGFAFVRRVTSGTEASDYFSIAEFFIQKYARRSGLGQSAVKELLTHHDAPWLIQVLEHNQPALAFWQTTLNEIYQQKLVPTMDAGFYNFWLAR